MSAGTTWASAPDADQVSDVQIYEVAEYSQVPIPIDDIVRGSRVDIDPRVLKYFSLSLRGGQLVLTTRGFVGQIPINPRAVVDVSPRVPIANLEHLLQVAGGHAIVLREHLRQYTEHAIANASFADLLAAAFASAADEILIFGLYREYERRSGQTSFPRGRVLMRGTARLASRGNTRHVEAAWFEPTLSNAPNRALLAATDHCLTRYAARKQLSAMQHRVVRGLQRVEQALSTVDDGRAGDWLTSPLVEEPQRMPTHRQYYEPALRLAAAIVRNRGLQLRSEGGLPLPSIVLNLEEVFEKYVRNILVRHAALMNLTVANGALLPPMGAQRPLFDGRPEPTAEPDIVVADSRRRDSPPIVVEVKYKPVEHLPAREDLNQTITYATVYGASAAVLLHPRALDGRKGLATLGATGKVLVYTYAFDLAAADLEVEEKTFAEALARLLNTGGPP